MRNPHHANVRYENSLQNPVSIANALTLAFYALANKGYTAQNTRDFIGDEWVREIKIRHNPDTMRIILVHNGIVRGASKQGTKPTGRA
ncbi:MAG: hypothetical protein LBQ00_00555 [Syntrophobacterales bacterium]|jgi:hypothetical protein|nr:hypothetical protein [Syntrophobacterales bacterium]